MVNSYPQRRHVPLLADPLKANPRPSNPTHALHEQWCRDEHRSPPRSRDFTAEAPGTTLVGDVTYIPTKEGWLYLATTIDCRQY
jgi:transposase InsO family protein